jgi:hypothetical protein
MSKKFDAKKVLKKYKNGGLLKKEIMNDPKLAGGGYVMEDVLKKENYPKKAKGGSVLREGEKNMIKDARKGSDCPSQQPVRKAKGGWIKGAVKKPGALRAIAEKRKLIKGKEKLSSSDLSKLGSQAKKSGNSLLAKRVSLAKTFAKMRKK